MLLEYVVGSLLGEVIARNINSLITRKGVGKYTIIPSLIAYYFLSRVFLNLAHQILLFMMVEITLSYLVSLLFARKFLFFSITILLSAMLYNYAPFWLALIEASTLSILLYISTNTSWERISKGLNERLLSNKYPEEVVNEIIEHLKETLKIN